MTTSIQPRASSGRCSGMNGSPEASTSGRSMGRLPGLPSRSLSIAGFFTLIWGARPVGFGRREDSPDRAGLARDQQHRITGGPRALKPPFFKTRRPLHLRARSGLPPKARRFFDMPPQGWSMDRHGARPIDSSRACRAARRPEYSVRSPRASRNNSSSS